MPVARAWSLDAARRARLGFSGSKTKLAFWKSNVRARLLREATSQTTRDAAIYLPANGQTVVRNDEREGTLGIFSVPFRGL